MPQSLPQSQPVLRCNLCNKPFDKQSSLKRHGYYCRTRKDGKAVRSRSCLACVKSKVRCDNHRPQCSRCAAKAIDCRYPGRVAHRRVSQVTQTQNQSSDHLTDFSEAGIRPVVADGVFPTPESVNSATLPDEQELPTTQGLDFTDISLLGQPSKDQLFFDQWTLPSFLTETTSPFARNTSTSTLISDLSIPSSPEYEIRSLIKRKKVDPRLQRVTMLIMHMMKSYPEMLLQDDNLPPFIHPGLAKSELLYPSMECLTNCINLVRMVSGKTDSSSRKLFWKNVRMECVQLRHKLSGEHTKLNKWELLAAMQAMSIYVIMRVDEGETEHNNFDRMLVDTVIAVAKHLNSIELPDTDYALLLGNDLKTAWQDWIFEESTRRLCVIYQTMNLLVYFEPAAMCDHRELVLAPLPTKKHIWEAADQNTWNSRRSKEVGGQMDFGLAANGELVRLYHDRMYCREGMLGEVSGKGGSGEAMTAGINGYGVSNWEEWCAGMDGMGVLVMMAASLV